MYLSHPGYLPLQSDQEISSTGEILSSAARRFTDKVGLIDGPGRWTFGELDALANQFANALVKTLANEDGPVAIMGRNSVEYAIAHFGTARTGLHTVNLPTRCTEDELVHVINLTRPAVLIRNPEYEEVVDAACERCGIAPLRLCMGPGGSDASADMWQFLLGETGAQPDIPVDPDASGSIIFTGGTTGMPKAVLSSQRARAVSAMAAIEDFRIETTQVAGYSVPFTHTAGLFSWFQPAVLAGCTGVLIPKWDPEAFMALTETHGINVIFAVPAQLTTLLAHPAFDPQRLRSLKRIVFGGAPLLPALIERAEDAMPWMECARAYGSSETGHLAAQIKSDREVVFDGYNQPGGRLQVDVFKEPGIVAEIGETGEVATRGPHLMTGYLDNETAQQEFFKTDTTDGQWGWTGDLAIKHDGYFTLVGRRKHMILSGGLNIFPAELEGLLGSHPQVADCVVFGTEDSVWGELPSAAIVASDSNVDEQGIMDFVADRVARHKRIRKIYFLDKIPRTVAGKAQIHRVKELCRV